jgi:hypothetical protein
VRLSTVALGLLAVLAMAVGCGQDGKDEVLAQLVEDPMASRSQPHARLITADDVHASRGGLIFSKPRYTKVLRAFAPQGQSATDLHQQLLASAIASGWRIEPGPNGTGTKQFAFGQAMISIDVNRYVSPVQVTVVLEPARE